ncbi:ParB/RepB/Spo0J family partition protein [Mediterraneibacter gnavus]|uniref:Chromosome partitioning protein ParB n=1 Tax=Mediterraneibacter gnavus TaxID=33038 RepID=A0A2N5Q065_MEDGN|nr:ParB/RepB/Spo0J family partition protein [Mediterraneibacter gnavus]PLT87023.1 chromosome partitioning protein ParB [Mediterraneibacter gnavus]
MKQRVGEKIKLTSFNDLMGIPEGESSVEIEIKRIVPFQNHPFKVKDDEKMEELMESIRLQGILTPVLVRPDDTDGYEMISGHRRMHAAQRLGLETIPAIVKEMTDDESTIAMVNANIQREELLPSERAFAYKMKLEAMKRQGSRRDLTSGQNVPKLATDTIGAENGESGRQVKRYIRLTELIPELLDMVDEKRLGFTIAVDISYISQDIQKWLYEYIKENGVIKPEQVAKLREHLQHSKINQMEMIQLLNGSLKGRIPSKKVTLSEKKLYKYFPPHYSASEMEGVIVTLLEEWKQRQAGE